MTILAATVLTLCPAVGVRVDCVHDGDSGWIGRQKWRAEDYDTPELNGRCPYERALAIRARDRALALLNRPNVTYTTHGYDRMQKPRVLVRWSIDGEPLASILVSEGLARRWTKRRMPWCPAAPAAS